MSCSLAFSPAPSLALDSSVLLVDYAVVILAVPCVWGKLFMPPADNLTNLCRRLCGSNFSKSKVELPMHYLSHPFPGAQLLDSIARFCPVAAEAIASAGQMAELHFRIAAQAPTTAANRLHNWQSILWIMQRVSGEDVDPDEKRYDESLCVWESVAFCVN